MNSLVVQNNGSVIVQMPGIGVIQAALNAASPGGIVKLCSGIFTEDAGLVLPSGVSLQGAGRDITIIQSALNSTTLKSILMPGNGSVISDLTVTATLAIPNHQALIGPLTSDTPWTTAAFLRNVRLVGQSDVIYTNQSCGDLTCWDCRFESSFDAIGWGYGGTPGALSLYNCEIVITGGASWGSTHWGMYGGKTRMYGGLVSVNGAFDANTGFVLNAFTDDIKLHNVTFDIGAPGGGGGTSYDIDNAGGNASNMVINGCVRLDGTPLQIHGTMSRNITSSRTGVTVANLPANPAQGEIAVVTDGTSALAWGATVTGGSSTKYLVAYNGAAWTIIGK